MNMHINDANCILDYSKKSSLKKVYKLITSKCISMQIFASFYKGTLIYSPSINKLTHMLPYKIVYFSNV